MAKSDNQKTKILYLMKLFTERTDEENPVTMGGIISYLADRDIKAERKSIYSDIETLRLFGMDIILRREAPMGYYLADRLFELAELKLLVDAVQCSKFITLKKSNELIRKLESLAGIHDAKKLHRQVYVCNRVKTGNETVYYSIDKIHNAIMNNRKISFNYFEWTIYKEERLRKNGKLYVISPVALNWDDEYYYLVGYDAEADIFKHYRVDKMVKISQLNESRENIDAIKNFDVAEYCKKMFRMFSGVEQIVSVEFKNSYIGVVIDQFGSDIPVNKTDEGHFTARIKANVSGQFFGWITGLGEGVRIVSPESVAEEYKKYLKNILESY